MHGYSRYLILAPKASCSANTKSGRKGKVSFVSLARPLARPFTENGELLFVLNPDFDGYGHAICGHPANPATLSQLNMAFRAWWTSLGEEEVYI